MLLLHNLHLIFKKRECRQSVFLLLIDLHINTLYTRFFYFLYVFVGHCRLITVIIIKLATNVQVSSNLQCMYSFSDRV